MRELINHELNGYLLVLQQWKTRFQDHLQCTKLDHQMRPETLEIHRLVLLSKYISKFLRYLSDPHLRINVTQDPRIDFESEGVKIVLYLVSPGGASMVNARGENFMFWFSRTQKKTFLDKFSKNLFLCHKHFVPPSPPVAWALLKDLADYLKNAMWKFSD